MAIDTGDTAWVLASAALVLLMIPAVGLFYGGMVRSKNILSTIMMSFAILALISLQWILFGYSLAFGSDISGLIGNLEFVGLNGVGQEAAGIAPTIPHLAFMLFQAMFAIITPVLLTGALVERIKFSGLLVFTLLWATLVYDPIAHWVWGGGWLGGLGALDFAGGFAVHISSGVSALAMVAVIGPRKGFGKTPMEPSNIPLTLVGAILLWFGWFGFNGGSNSCHQHIGSGRGFHVDAAQLEGQEAKRSWNSDRGCRRSCGNNSCFRICISDVGYYNRHRCRRNMLQSPVI
jgi:Amt family ammonium transporter